MVLLDGAGAVIARTPGLRSPGGRGDPGDVERPTIPGSPRRFAPRDDGSVRTRRALGAGAAGRATLGATPISGRAPPVPRQTPREPAAIIESIAATPQTALD